MKRAPRPLHRVIAEDATLAAWQARRAREQALVGALRRHLPRQLGDRVRAAELESGEIELITPAGAVAAAVRQRTPDLVVALQREGWTCRGIRVRVQVTTATEAPTKIAPRPIDRAALAPLAKLNADLPAGPLKTALARLLRRTGGA
ncbi:MAG TPA: DciA family protein [Casimicrobiaceae bacterium]|nr:DciA family protein [Casimicrobiaceae bacterium]